MSNLSKWNEAGIVFGASLGIMIGAFALGKYAEANHLEAAGATTAAEQATSIGDLALVCSGVELGLAAAGGIAIGRLSRRREEEPADNNPAVFIIGS